jgi:hypothetical protein
VLNSIKREDLIDKFIIYYHSGEHQDKWRRLDKVDAKCSNWMHKDEVHELKMDLFVQEIEGGYIEEPVQPNKDNEAIL